MAVVLRLKRFGRRHRAYYRLNAMDKRSARDSRVIEELGSYDPMGVDIHSKVKFKMDRIKHWLSIGAQPSETVAGLLKDLEQAGEPAEVAEPASS